MNVCVFCGSSTGGNPVYAKAAEDLGYLLAANGHTLVYGGGNIGLMGIVADAVLQYSGRVIGVIPDFLKKKEVGHTGLTQLIVVHSMHERKRTMADFSDAFIALPGGWGTLEETAEILTWRQLSLIQQPVGILNTNNFFDSLIHQMQKMVDEGFLKKQNFETIKVGRTPAELLSLIIP
jgi:uncharacterized protein (TIGR00730 family)